MAAERPAVTSTNAPTDRFVVIGPVTERTQACVLATDRTSGKRVVLKSGGFDEIRREAGVLRDLDHPGVVRLVDIDTHDGHASLVTDYVEGFDLLQYLPTCSTAADRQKLLAVMTQLADVISYVHGRGYLHRDLKPANLVVRSDQSPVVLDFGAAVERAAILSSDWSSALSDGFAAPEQFLSDEPEGPWTDIYALAAISYRIVSGRMPPTSLARLDRDTLAAAISFLPEDAAELGRAIDWGLALEPRLRPQSAEEWKQALERAIGTLSPDAKPALAIKDETRPNEHDDYPPTRKVHRVRKRRRPVEPPSVPPAVARQRPRGATRLSLALVVAAAIIAPAVWYGWPYYQRYFKQEWTVGGPGGDVATIGEAIARSGADAIIRVGPGTYAESLVLERPIQLVSAVPDEPAVIASPARPCLLTGTSATIESLIFRPASEAEPSDRACIELADDAIFRGNTIEVVEGTAMAVLGGAAPVIERNSISGGPGPAIQFLTGSGGSLIDNDIAEVDGLSLVVRGGATPEITNNRFTDTGGLLVAEGAAPAIRENSLAQIRTTAIEVASGADPYVEENTIQAAAEAGLFIHSGATGTFETNRIFGSAVAGIVITESAAPQLVANEVVESGEHGIVVLAAGEGLLAENVIKENTGHGIVVDPSSQIDIANNIVEGNEEPQVMDLRPE